MKTKKPLLFLFILLFTLAVLLNAFISPFWHQDVRLDVSLDDKGRPAIVSSYIIGSTGEKIKHGETVEFDWDYGRVDRSIYRKNDLYHFDSREMESQWKRWTEKKCGFPSSQLSASENKQ